MTIQYINTGSSANAGNGDSLRSAFNKVNNNFSFLSTATVAGNSNIEVGAAAPLNSAIGDLWYDTVSGRIYVYYDSGWVDASPSVIGPPGPEGQPGADAIGEVLSGGQGQFAFYATSGDEVAPSDHVSLAQDNNTIIIGGQSTNFRYFRDSYSNAPGSGTVFSQHHEVADAVNFTFYRTRGSNSTQEPVQAGDDVADIVFAVYNQTEINNAVSAITVQVTNTSTGQAAGAMDFYTHDGANLNLSARITSSSTFETSKLAPVAGTTVSIAGNFIPAADITYDLGSPSNRFRDLYLSTSTIYLGDATISANGNVVELPVGTTTGGVSIGTIIILGSVVDQSSLPSDPSLTAGDSYVVSSPAPAHLWTYNGQTFVDLGVFQGPKGNIGFTGSFGFTGSTGAQGTSGLQGAVGFTGSQGTTGAQGIQGDVGTQGIQGEIGLTGPQGDTGTQGIQGSQGEVGFAGSQGIPGESAAVGFTGSQGIPGESAAVGFTGSSGDTGIQGSQGEVGFTGSQGIPGESAAVGFTGSTGASGFTGSSGFGFTGSTGATGNTGPAGATGADGATGPAGVNGLDSTVAGPQGPIGPAGASASISWSISASGSADYVFSGPGIFAGNTNDPVLYLYRGFTYTFVNNTGASHPFAIRVSNGGDSYTLGVSGSQTGTQTFNVPINAPSTLYYQCTIHGSMGNVINIV